MKIFLFFVVLVMTGIIAFYFNEKFMAGYFFGSAVGLISGYKICKLN